MPSMQTESMLTRWAQVSFPRFLSAGCRPCASPRIVSRASWLAGEQCIGAGFNVENPPRRCRRHVAHAKKKKSKGGKQKKGPGSLMDIPEEKLEEVPTVEPYEETHVIMDNLLLIESYSRVMGKPLLEGDLELTDIAQELWEAPFALLTHEFPEDGDAENAGPIFTYANKVALELFEAEWQELVGQPSSVSADEEAQAGRQEILDEARKAGKVENITSWRRTLKGTRFQVLGATLFNISSPSDEDGNIAGPDAPADSRIPTDDDISAAEQAVEDQGVEVRNLKEAGGLCNEDEPVQEAVKELLKRKDHLQKLKDRAALTAVAS